jgi:hypothetical protein
MKNKMLAATTTKKQGQHHSLLIIHPTLVVNQVHLPILGLFSIFPGVLKNKQKETFSTF